VEKVAELYVKSHRELGRRWNTSKPDTFPPVENDPDSITITFGPGHQNHLFHALGTFIPAIEAVHKYRGTEGNRYLSESEMEELRNAPTIRVSKSPNVFGQTQQATKMWRLHPTMRSLYNSGGSSYKSYQHSTSTHMQLLRIQRWGTVSLSSPRPCLAVPASIKLDKKGQSHLFREHTRSLRTFSMLPMR
jgi:hypothetical protein